MTTNPYMVIIFVDGKQETLCLSRETHQRFFRKTFDTWREVDLYIRAILDEDKYEV